ncbi:MAG: hypothetical protein K6A36_02710 [Paludibacteraceae bacterium]|nr:hypothetical protein [Paludibacteraceae bacterium]
MKKIFPLLALTAMLLALAGCDPKVNDTIPVSIATIGTSKNVTFWDGTYKVQKYGYWQLTAEDSTYVVSLRNANKINYVAGEYSVDKLDGDYSYIIRLADSTKIHFTSGKLKVISDDGGDRIIAKGTLVGDDNKAYELRIVFQAPYAFVTKEITVQNAYVDESYASQGLYGVYGGPADMKYYVQLYWEGDSLPGTYYRCDMCDPDCGINEFGDTLVSIGASDIYSVNLFVGIDTTKVFVNIVGNVLCYNNTLYKINMRGLNAPKPMPAKNAASKQPQMAAKYNNYFREK